MTVAARRSARPGAIATRIGLVVASIGPAVAQVPAGDGRGLFDPPRAAAPGAAAAPWTDAAGADHLRRDAERRAAGSATVRRSAAAPVPGTAPAPRSPDAVEAEAWRREGERERAARAGRGGPVLPSPAVPRIQPDAPASLAMPPSPPRIAIPGPGEPGGPPVAVPLCGPAGCVDANGRVLPSAGGGVLIGPGGRPCTVVGGAASC